MGRPKGSVNKATREFRETVQALLEENRNNVGTWLTQVAEGHGEVKPAPEKALDLLAKLAEYAAPKLARTEHTGKDGEAMKHEFTWLGS
jgi:phage-related minor tail protein